MRSHAALALALALTACSSAEPVPSASLSLPEPVLDYDPELVTIPFAVDDHYISSGCMGDCALSVAIDKDCTERGATDAQGDCHHFRYTGQSGASREGWAGVLWQTVENNWGSRDERAVAPGARQLRFWARSMRGNLELTILAGAMDAADGGKACARDADCASRKCEASVCALPFRDTLQLAVPKLLTVTWQEFTIPFGDGDYGSRVLSAFGWSATTPPTDGPVEFYLDDLRWE